MSVIMSRYIGYYPGSGGSSDQPGGDDNFGLPEVGTPLNSMAWEEVRAISDAGLAANYFSVGDTKSIVINGKVGATTFSNLSIDAFILGIDHNASIEGTNKIHFGLGKISGVDVALKGSGFIMKPTGTSYAGWASCNMRKTVLGSDSTPTSPTANTLLAALPADLRAVMKGITKYTENQGGTSSSAGYVTATTEYLPLLAEFEVFGTCTYANTYEQYNQAQYDYFKAGNSTKKYAHDDTTTGVFWWLRSLAPGAMTGMGCIVMTGGTVYTLAVENNNYPISPLFAV